MSIPTAHPSCSRIHARLAFDEMGRAWLKDMGSTHGTRVNKRPLPDEACVRKGPRQKQEEEVEEDGGRCKGVMIFCGDVISFGESTRLYCVIGPEEFEREVWNQRQVKMKAERKAQKAREDADAMVSSTAAGGGGGGVISSVVVDEQNYNRDINDPKVGGKQDSVDRVADGCSWGMDDDEHEHAHSDSSHGGGANGSLSSFGMHASKTAVEGLRLNPGTTLCSSSIPDKYRKCYEKIEAKRYKLSNLQLESERIRNKQYSMSGGGEDGGLTHGQSAQLARNQEREESLIREIAEQEDALRLRMEGDGNGEKSRVGKVSAKRKQYLDNLFQDEEVEDRTKNVKKNSAQDLDDEKSLTIRWKKGMKKLKDIDKILLFARRKVETLQMTLSSMSHTADDSDQFFVKNDLELANDDFENKKKEKESILNELDETEKLLKLINEKIVIDRKTLYVGNKISNVSSNEKVSPLKRNLNESSSMPPPPSLQRREKCPQGSSSMMPPPPSVLKSSTISMPPPPSVHKKIGSAVEPLKMSPPTRQIGIDRNPSKGIISDKNVTGTETRSIMPPPKRQVGPERRALKGTLDIVKESMNSAQGLKSTPMLKTENSVSNTKTSNNAVDEKQNLWRAPKGQSGDGFTKLNEKFAGRY